MNRLIWFAGLVVYILAVAGRTSFGVASVEAIGRFDASASQLSLFVVIQLLVYALAQIPVGLLLDRYGSKPVLVTGAIILGLGQIWVGLASSLGSALAARIFIGIGDATAFAAVLRLIPQWFEPRQIPLYTQLTSLGGQAGQVISSLPFAYALATWGWTVAFVGLGIIGALGGIVAGGIVREKDTTTVDRTVPVTVATKHPGTWLGFWTHFLLSFPGTVVTLMWGVPLMVASGFDPQFAAGLLVVSTATFVVAGPAVARFCALHPLRRSWLVLAILTLVVLSWAAVAFLPGPLRLWQVILLLVSTAIAGSGSIIGFDYARTFIPLTRLGTANGLINQGGFYAAVIASFAMGVVLDVVSTGAPTPDDFKVAVSVQFIIAAIGLAGFLSARAKTRAHMAAHGTVVPPIRDVVRRILDSRHH